MWLRCNQFLSFRLPIVGPDPGRMTEIERCPSGQAVRVRELIVESTERDDVTVVGAQAIQQSSPQDGLLVRVQGRYWLTIGAW